MQVNDDSIAGRRSAAVRLEEPLRVLVVGHTYVVGANQSKLTELAARGRTRISLLTPREWPASDWGHTFVLDRVAKSVEFKPQRAFCGGRNGAHFYSPWALYVVFKAVMPELVHVEQEVFSLSALQFAFFSWLFRVPLVVFCWQNVEPRHSLLRRWSRRLVLNRARCIIAGNTGAEELLRRWGYRGRIEQMPQLGVDKVLSTPRRTSPKGGEFQIGFVGLLSYRKGLDVLLAALRELLDRGRRCRLSVVGSGPYETQLKELTEVLGLASAVSWRGLVPHERVLNEMAAFDVLVLPTRTVPGNAEQFGHVLIESMSMGIPTVGSTCGEIPLVIGRKDLVFAEENHRALTDLLDRLILDVQWREEAGAYGMARVQQMFTNRTLAARLEAVWQEVLTAEGRA